MEIYYICLAPVKYGGSGWRVRNGGCGDKTHRLCCAIRVKHSRPGGEFVPEDAPPLLSEAEFRRRLPALLRFAREARGLSQEQVAAVVGVHYNDYGRWERGGSLPSTDNLGPLCLALMIPTRVMLFPPTEKALRRLSLHSRLLAMQAEAESAGTDLLSLLSDRSSPEQLLRGDEPEPDRPDNGE